MGNKTSDKEWLLESKSGISIYQICSDSDRCKTNPNLVVIKIENPSEFSVCRGEWPAETPESPLVVGIPVDDFDEIAAAWCLKRRLIIGNYSPDKMLNKRGLKTQENKEDELLSLTETVSEQEHCVSSDQKSLFDEDMRAIDDPTIFYRLFSSDDFDYSEKAAFLAATEWSFYVSVDEDYTHPSGCIIKSGVFIFSDCPVKLLKFLTDYSNSSKVIYEVDDEFGNDVIAQIYIEPLQKIGNDPYWINIDKERSLSSVEEDRYLREHIIDSGFTKPLHFGDRKEFIDIELL